MFNDSRIILWTSLYQRAKETAEIIKSKVICKYREEILLVEQSFGLAVGAPSIEEYAESNEEQKRLFFKSGKKFMALPQGESMVDVALRAETFLHKISSMELRHIVVSHQGFCSMLHSQITGEYSDNWKWGNGDVRKYEKKPKEPIMYKGILT